MPYKAWLAGVLALSDSIVAIKQINVQHMDTSKVYHRRYTENITSIVKSEYLSIQGRIHVLGLSFRGQTLFNGRLKITTVIYFMIQ